MSLPYLAGIDIGTTGSKVAIYDLKGNPAASAYREYPCIYPKPEWVDQDADLVVKSMMEGCREAVSKSGINPKAIASLGVSAQRCCSHFLDDQGKLVRPMISWMDNRPLEEVEEIENEISALDFYDITGMPLNTTWMLPKMLWLRKNEPEHWKRTARIVQMHDYALKAFGADDYYIDVSDAAFYGLWDPYRITWNERLLSMFDIDPALLPIPKPSGEQIGVISKEAAELSGFASGMPLCTGAGDQNSAAVGAGVVHLHIPEQSCHHSV